MGYELEFGPGWTTLVDHIEALCYIKDNQSSIALFLPYQSVRRMRFDI
jgi:hypothetical protein